jgi:hypothetical protein
MATVEDFHAAWMASDSSDHEKNMARRRMVAGLVLQSVGDVGEIDLVVEYLHDETVDIDDSELDQIATRARLNKRHPMEDRNPSKTAVKNHIAYLCNLTK